MRAPSLLGIAVHAPSSAPSEAATARRACLPRGESALVAGGVRVSIKSCSRSGRASSIRRCAPGVRLAASGWAQQGAKRHQFDKIRKAEGASGARMLKLVPHSPARERAGGTGYIALGGTAARKVPRVRQRAPRFHPLDDIVRPVIGPNPLAASRKGPPLRVRALRPPSSLVPWKARSRRRHR